MTLTSQQAALLLCRIPNLGPRRIKKLIDHCDGAKNVLKATLDKLLQINGVGPSHIKYLERWKAHLPQLKKEEKRAGCLSLIKNDQARMIRHVKDFIQWMNWEGKAPKKNIQKNLFVELLPEEQKILEQLEVASSIDEISLKCKQPIGSIASILLQLELKGIVRSIAGKKFERC